jgi:hypothetical protein
MVFVLLLSVVSTDLPASTEKKLESLRHAVGAEREAAGAVLLNAIDTHKKMVANQPGLPAETRINHAAAVDRERSSFVSHQSLPLSAGLRDDSLAYLDRVAKVEAKLMKALDQAAAAATKDGDTHLAKTLISEKKSVPQVFAKFHCTFRWPGGRTDVWEWQWYSDGTMNRDFAKWDVHPKWWRFDLKKQQFVLTNVTAESPKGGFKDVCKLDADGRGFDGTNQNGGKYRAVRVD